MEETKEKTEDNLNKTEQPKKRVVVSNLPRDANGKILPSPGRKKMTKAEKEKKEIIKKTKEGVIKYLEGQGHGAATRIVKMSKKPLNDGVKLSANKDILDRIGVGVQKGPGVAIQINVGEDRTQYA